MDNTTGTIDATASQLSENSLSRISQRSSSVPSSPVSDIELTSSIHPQYALAHLGAIVTSSDDAIISKDLNGIIVTWNQAAERVFGYKAEEVIGKSITILIPPELQGDEVIILSKIRAGERIEHFQTVRLTKSGEPLDISLTVSPIKDREGHIIGAAKIARDITHQRHLERILHASERLASVGRLAATIAHEINNPLEAITNFIYLARQQPEISTTTRVYLDTADQELKRVAHIVQQTLGFYRENAHPSTRQVASVIEDVLAIYERKYRHKNIEVVRRVQPGLAISTMQGELKQVLSNIIANAIDASTAGSRIIIRGRLATNPRTGVPGARITVADFGSGISPQNSLLLFMPFFTTKREIGTGLGLWISRDLLEKRGGNIRFRSRDTAPSGTVMSIYLPLSPPKAAEPSPSLAASIAAPSLSTAA
jgi:PAS domain S-box-containing protein